MDKVRPARSFTSRSLSRALVWFVLLELLNQLFPASLRFGATWMSIATVSIFLGVCGAAIDDWTRGKPFPVENRFIVAIATVMWIAVCVIDLRRDPPLDDTASIGVAGLLTEIFPIAGRYIGRKRAERKSRKDPPE